MLKKAVAKSELGMYDEHEKKVLSGCLPLAVADVDPWSSELFDLAFDDAPARRTYRRLGDGLSKFLGKLDSCGASSQKRRRFYKKDEVTIKSFEVWAKEHFQYIETHEERRGFLKLWRLRELRGCLDGGRWFAGNIRSFRYGSARRESSGLVRLTRCQCDPAWVCSSQPRTGIALILESWVARAKRLTTALRKAIGHTETLNLRQR